MRPLMLSEPQPLVTVVIPTRNRLDKLSRCLDSVYGSDYRELEAVVVDDASDRPVAPQLSAAYPKTRFIRNQERRLLSCSRNSGAAASKGEYLFFLDDDNVLAPDTIRLLAETLHRHETVAVASPIIFYLARPRVVWTSYIARGRFPGFYKLHVDIPGTESPTFSFHNSFMVKRGVFEKLGGFDCKDFPIRFSEVDFAHRLAERGYVALVNPAASVWHDLGWAMVHIDSARSYYTERNRIIVIKRYYPKSALRFYTLCILPFIGTYYLFHHSISSTDSRIRTAEAFLRGVVSGLTFVPTRGS
jgi:GT2 family glycosyltransferase